MATHQNRVFGDRPVNNTNLNKRLEEAGWGFFLLLIGTLLLLPNEWVPQGTWLLGAGLIMLGLSCIRYLNGIATSGFTVGLGVIAVLLGVSAFFGLRPPFFAILLALIGLSIIVRSLLPARTGKGFAQKSQPKKQA